MMKKIFKGILMGLFLAVFFAGCGSNVAEDLLPSPNDNTAPTVQSTLPANGAADVSINKKILATFD